MVDFDFAVLGSGFSGSICASLLAKLGKRVLLVDRDRHPRFAIGESSTPIANAILRSFASEYELPVLAELSRWGSWKQHHPGINCGLKRGFSYFYQPLDAAFQGHRDYRDRLLVAASSADEVGDTQWYRPNVDEALFRMAEDAGVVAWQSVDVRTIERDTHAWRLEIADADQLNRVRVPFLVDATGAGSLLPTYLSLEQRACKTQSFGVYGHFRDVMPWESHLETHQIERSDHPFSADHAALHQVFAGGWMWQLRFDDDITSVGLMLAGAPPAHSATKLWQQWLGRLPSLEAQFSKASVVAPSNQLVKSNRLQRRIEPAAGEQWVLLPNTAGFIDPLHSTGIAQSLSGIEHFISAVRADSWTTAAAENYTAGLSAEFDLIDRLVHGCYRLSGLFEAYVDYCMVYFAAATSYEIKREEMGSLPEEGLLFSQNRAFLDATRRIEATVDDVLAKRLTTQRFGELVAAELRPFNRVGLCRPENRNLYRYTAHE